MSTTNIYKVHYHFEYGGKKTSQDYYNYLAAAANDYASLKTVLSNNSLLQGGTLVIDAVQNLPTGGSTGVYS